jgi:hypothetical protein
MKSLSACNFKVRSAGSRTRTNSKARYWMADSSWERRRARRLSVRFGATVCWTDSTGQQVIENTHTFSLSDTGAGLATMVQPPVGEKAKVTLDVGGPSGSCMCEIRWARPSEHGFLVGLLFTT